MFKNNAGVKFKNGPRTGFIPFKNRKSVYWRIAFALCDKHMKKIARPFCHFSKEPGRWTMFLLL